MDNPPSDGELVARLAAGDPTALWQLWQRHQEELLRHCGRWMGGCPADAEDALSTAMIKTWELLPGQAAGVINVRAWLLRVTHNVCMDFHRERRRRKRLANGFAEPHTLAAETSRGAHSPEEALLRREVSSCVRHAIHELPAALRQPVVLRFFRDMPHRDIAERLELSSDNVRKRLQYARGILGSRLKTLLSGSQRPRAVEPRSPRRPGTTRRCTPRRAS